MINEITPRLEISLIDAPAVFLAGTIDMGNSEDWQKEIVARLSGDGMALNVFNPRRPGFTQFDEDEQNFQINWELDRLLEKHIPLKSVLFNFLENSKSPVTMLELGICLERYGSRNIIVCPKGFYRYDNVKLTAERWGVRVYENMADGYCALTGTLNEK